MFERRLKLFLVVLIAVTVVLVVRASQLQIAQRGEWARQASAMTTRDRLVETTRGRILDIKGRVLAEDQACIDACVDYRAILKEPDPQWLLEQARVRARVRHGDQWKSSDKTGRQKMLDDELKLTRADIDRMWVMLAHVSRQTPEEIDELRNSIIRRVEMRRRFIWWKRHEAARLEQSSREKPDWLAGWLMGDDTQGPKIDEFEIRIDEQVSPHVILRAIDVPLQNKLSKELERFPGLSIRPSTHRFYPYGNIACHVIGHLGKVQREDLASDPRADDELGKYLPNDAIGRDGLEALGEPTLRGTRGSESQSTGSDALVQTSAPAAGSDLTSTIDIELQQDIQLLFEHARIPWDRDGQQFDEVSMHGAAVVIDVSTGQVRAMVSNPTFDLNTLDEKFGEILRDPVNSPLLHRATQSTLEPGSTVKPMVGLGAITQGLIGANEGIECTGYLMVGGRRYSVLRCWTASKFAGTEYGALVPHHMLPSQEPHRGHHGNPDGFLSFADALQRSCNVYFENIADRLSITGISYWFDRFGLGRPTGVGIAESVGRLPRNYAGARIDFTTWAAGIGQGYIAATPLQMCNAVATIARDGIWLRPSLVVAGTQVRPYKPKSARASDAWNDVPSRVDLKLSPEAIRAAKEGMVKVVNTVAGTGKQAARTDVLVAGKTGTAQAAPLAINRSNDPDHPDLEFPEPSTHQRPNPLVPWYRGYDSDGKNLKHAWFIGFAPADNPQVAFAVMVEYGGGGGAVAGPIAQGVLEALLVHGYLPRRVAETDRD